MADVENHVFINCPFDAEYRPPLRGDGLHDSPLRLRRPLGHGGRRRKPGRIDKIATIIGETPLGIHDISRTEPDAGSGLPRFNMPLELGMFLGAKRYGNPRQRRKRCLILDRDRYRYQQFCSDIAGQDIRAHQNDPAVLIRVLRDWLRNALMHTATLPGATRIAERYAIFQSELPLICRLLGMDADELVFNDLTMLISAWLREN